MTKEHLYIFNMDDNTLKITSLIRAKIKETLPNLQEQVLQKATQELIDAGVGEVEDLEYVQEEYLAETLKPIQRRKLITAFTGEFMRLTNCLRAVLIIHCIFVEFCRTKLGAFQYICEDILTGIKFMMGSMCGFIGLNIFCEL